MLERYFWKIKSILIFEQTWFFMEYVIYVVHQRFQTLQDTSKKLWGSFPSYAEAKIFCDHVVSNPENKNIEFDISPIPLLFNIDEKPCTRISPKNHMPFDLSHMEFPIRCDLCTKNARFFCIIHSGLYCLFHVSMHDWLRSKLDHGYGNHNPKVIKNLVFTRLSGITL
jgi:hypothetical protein